MNQLRVLTWHIHGSYLFSLVQTPHKFFLPVKPSVPEGYGGCAAGFPWPENVSEVPAEDVKRLDLDCIIFQSSKNYLDDQYEILSEAQRSAGRIYIEHDPPQRHPTDTRHIVVDPDVLLVHVTHFNRLMWDSGATRTRVIEHGVPRPEATYTGEIERGLVVINGITKRDRRVGADIFQEVRARVPLDLVGMDSEDAGGLGEISHSELPAFAARYRFFFNPIRYTSLGLAVCEAMMLGMPIIGLATTEMARVVQNGVSGYVDTDIGTLIARMQELLRSPATARQLGAAARRFAERHFSIGRFSADWDSTLRAVAAESGRQKRSAA